MYVTKNKIPPAAAAELAVKNHKIKMNSQCARDAKTITFLAVLSDTAKRRKNANNNSDANHIHGI
jgi:hypothetical protein